MSVATAQPPLELSMKRAVEIATSPEGNTNIQLSEYNLARIDLAQAMGMVRRAVL